MLRLLHLSDIHFNKKKGTNDHHIELSDGIVNDLTRLMSVQPQTIDYILVCGDVAFSGHPKEYSKATEWLNKICKIVGCKESNVLVIPGNHDIDRNVVQDSKHQSLLHAHIKGLKTNEADEFLGDLLENKDYNILKRPLKNFYDFATQYDCVPKKEELHWELLKSDFGNYSICFRGCNSALLADKTDDDLQNRMFISKHQRYVNKSDGLLYIVICHHPTEWLIDQAEAEVEFDKKAVLQLYGHKHKFHTVPKEKSIIIHAGAVHPDDSQYTPCYNIIDLEITNKNSIDYFNVKIWIREWDGDSFASGVDNGTGESFVEHEIPIKTNSGNWSMVAEDKVEKNKEKLQMVIEQIDIKIEESNDEFTEREIRFKFLTLPFSKRKEIGEQMIANSFSDKTTSEVQRSIDFLFKVKNECRYPELWNKIK
jgi:predicted MPP superfamily phosphohydrolase